MNNHTRLLTLLDEVFGPDEKLKSSFRKVRQAYDERTDEHVVLIEYRVREKGAVKTTPKGWQQPSSGNLLRQVNDQAKQPLREREHVRADCPRPDRTLLEHAAEEPRQ